ncbi:hypothetical protein QP162_20685 [Sphingomonas aurantiaca]|uniref:hypothetical protein n=1 Tax=Sphingomonas aurantiaca TaxID=185949 RepID=UPI002FE1B407
MSVKARLGRATMVEGVKDVLAYARAAYRGVVRKRARPARGGQAGAQKHVLMIDDLVPDPLFGAGYPRAFAIVQSLVAAGHRVSFYPMRSSPADIDRMTTAFAGAVLFHPGAGGRGLRRLLWTHGADVDLAVHQPADADGGVRAGGLAGGGQGGGQGGAAIRSGRLRCRSRAGLARGASAGAVRHALVGSGLSGRDRRRACGRTHRRRGDRGG